MSKITVTNNGPLSRITCPEAEVDFQCSTVHVPSRLAKIKELHDLQDAEVVEVQGRIAPIETVDERPERKPEPPHSNLPKSPAADAGME